MPREKRPPFLAVDLDLMEDPQVRKLARKLGRGAVLLWLEILMRFHDYEEYDFMVPLEDLEDFKEGYFMATSEDVGRVISMAAGFGWLKIWKDAEGREFMYSERRRTDLQMQKLSMLNRQKHIQEVNERKKNSVCTNDCSS